VEYLKYCKSKSRNVVLTSIDKNGTLTPYCAAQALYYQHKNHFVYTDSRLWFHYENHKWNMTSEGIELRKRICDLIQPIQEEIDKIRTKIRNIDEQIRDKEESNQYVEGNDLDEKTKGTLDKKRLALIKEKNRLEDTGVKDKILKECRELFFDKEFENKLDTDVYTLGFTNGVLDLKTKAFREGRPDDFISLSTNYEFREFEDSDMEMKMVDDYINKVFPDHDIRTYFLDQCCMYLRGGNISKKVTIWSGCGDNSKSVTIELIQNILGQYAIEFPTSMLTEKRSQSSAAAPELVRSRGRRFAVIQEPNESDMINVGLLKELSGNDRITTRALYKDQVEFRPLFKLSIICNKLPRIPSDDTATWNRLRVIPFESRFIDVKDCPKSLDEQFAAKTFPKDPIFSEKLPKMKQAFMYKLYQRYIHAERHGMVPGEPEKVLMATRKYRSANDVFMNFLSDQLIEDPESLGVMLPDLYEQFKTWFKSNYSGKFVSPRHELKDYLANRYRKHFVINRLVGYRYRTEEDDEADSR
jgi:P4 family phage/plasmid primase-like protien